MIHQPFHKLSPHPAEQRAPTSGLALEGAAAYQAVPLGAAGLTTLQVLRAFAAILVVLFHTSYSIFGTDKYWLDKPFGRTFDFGHAGVEVFFVLSGFIIYTAHRKDIGEESRLVCFAWKRFRRIYPVYWVMLVLVAPLYLLFPNIGTGVERDPGVMIDSLSLMHLFGRGNVILTVSWTLFHEMLFYGMFALLILSRTLGAIAMGLWMAASVASLAIGAPATELFAFYVSPLHLLFGAGMATAWLTNSLWIGAVAWLANRGKSATLFAKAAPLAVAILGASIFFAAGGEEVSIGMMSRDVLTIVYGIGSSLVVLGAVGMERSGMLKMPRVLVFLGDASYSIYLVHFVALSVLAKLALVASSHLHVSHTVVFVALTGGSLAAGVVFHLSVEVPLLGWIGSRRPAVHWNALGAAVARVRG